MWWKTQLFKETLACFYRRVCRLLEFAVHIWMQIRMLDFPWVLCELLLLLTWKLFSFPCLTIVFVWVICIPETRCATLDIFPLLNIIVYIYYLKAVQFEAVTLGFRCIFHSCGLLQWPTDLPRQNIVRNRIVKNLRQLRHHLAYHCYGTALESREKTKEEKRKFKFYFSQVCLRRLYKGVHHVVEPESPPVVSNKAADGASSDSIQKRAAAYPRAERVLAEDSENDPK